MSKKTYQANGKLLITGEYFVLDGALALAVPTRFGQSLTVEETDSNLIKWHSLDHQNKKWFSAIVSPADFSIQENTDTPIAERLQQILKAIRQQNTSFLTDNQGLTLTTKLEFPRDWGLGSSSTLLCLLAQWAKIDPYQLLQDTFGGSGYDIACAQVNSPIFYQIKDKKPVVRPITFYPDFHQQLHFVYLEKKQNSRSGIKHFREQSNRDSEALCREIATITEQIAKTNSYHYFLDFLQQHEQLVARAVKLPRVQELYFKDFPGVVKSLGAWGGDFVLTIGDLSTQETQAYFEKKGFSTVIPYAEMVK